jgi:putative acetyltransferase
MDAISLRTALPADFDTLGAVMFDAIHNGRTKYTSAQSQAWAPALRAGADWAERLQGKTLILAERGETVLGFMSIEPGGYVDFAYIRPEAQGSGLFRRLFQDVRARAVTAGETELSTHASLMAQPAFAAMGFEIDFHETVEVDGQKLDRARMTMTL